MKVPALQVLVEISLIGWKEYELEVRLHEGKLIGISRSGTALG